jgi:hypothetical protein
MHAFREHGRAIPRILYWFRTPPNVRVGRAALDEEAIRSIEEANPTLAFDWTRMVNAAPGPDQAAPRPKEREPRRSAPPAPAPEAPAPPPPAPEPVPPADEDANAEGPFEFADEREAALPPPAASRVEERVGHEGLSRLRARYSELMARIAQRVTDRVRLEELRAQAERLNPDTWVTDEEAGRGIEMFEAEWEAIRARLGHRRRRRRGGARRRGRSPGAGGAPDSGGGAPAV